MSAAIAQFRHAAFNASRVARLPDLPIFLYSNPSDANS
jgi:hypothetical protein